MAIAYTVIESPAGLILAAASERGLVMAALGPEAPGHLKAYLEQRFPGQPLEKADTEAGRQIREYLAGTRREFDLSLDLKGTDFQWRVWRALRDIPFGQTATYGEVARRLGLGRGAARAVGGACGANPAPLVVPCHRVLAAGGRLGGYSGGLPWKTWLLALEGRLPG
ncbi:MAG: methylated-DNA--[protein]-cysteine S-methyltransferase [Proteobacteria bacterium]|nr:methylated-DNA--[protein]-cysteine S-methyltransferase [Pseudomonadota bacterium]